MYIYMWIMDDINNNVISFTGFQHVSTILVGERCLASRVDCDTIYMHLLCSWIAAKESTVFSESLHFNKKCKLQNHGAVLQATEVCT